MNGIAAMPLHQITAIHGEPGLRFRFAHEAARLDGDDERIKAGRALALAGHLHHGDRRQNEPYINHPLRVALRVICHYNVLDADVICAALLHDTVEDHADRLSADGRPGALQVLAGQFGPQVGLLVAAVTNPRLRSRPRRARPVPRARRDEPDRLPVGAGDQGVRLHRQRRPVLEDLIARADTPLAADVKDRIRAQLSRTTGRLAQALNERR